MVNMKNYLITLFAIMLTGLMYTFEFIGNTTFTVLILIGVFSLTFQLFLPLFKRY